MKLDRVYIIAEAGVNHNGDLLLAKKLVDVAAEAGADAVKFQTFRAEKLVSRFAKKAAYQKITTKADESQLDMIKKLELDRKAHVELFNYSKKRKIQFLSSPFDLESVDWLQQLGLKIIKIPSGEIDNLPYLKKVGRYNKRIILSTGMATLGEVESAVQILSENGTIREKISLLHCNTEYPTPYVDVNLRAMITLKNALQLTVGYSDHTSGIEIPIAAVALGAEIIEKHFTLDKNLPGPDHQASLSVEELKEMVRSIRHIEQALGSPIKKPSLSELKNISIVRKSIVAAQLIHKGERFSENNITTKRPRNGISPMLWDDVVGKKARREFQSDELIEI